MRRPLALLTAAITAGALALTPAAAPATASDKGPSNPEQSKIQAGKKAPKKRCDPDAAVKPSELVPQPTVTGPIGNEGIRTGEPYATTMAPLPEGWVEEEFFFSGIARDYQGSDEGPRLYTQRILVRRPTDRAEFNGTMVFNWNNVTIPHDGNATGWESLYETADARGFAFVSVSAQYLGTEVSPLGLKQYDPVRYGALNHPGLAPGYARQGDDYSYDIFSQAAEAAITPEVMGDLLPCVRRRLAMGISWSADRLLKYIKGVHQQALVFDGFQPQHCTFWDGCAGLPADADVPTDLVPILWVNSQSEVDPGPADGELFRLWELAGQAHTSYSQNSYWTAVLAYSYSNGHAGTWDPEDAGTWGYRAAPGDCRVDTYLPESYGWGAALVALDDWVRTGITPDPQPRLERGVDPLGNVALVFDEHDNAVGGVRNPIVDVPIATYFVAPLSREPSQPCQVGEDVPTRGSTQVFDAAELAVLYPTPQDYLEKFDAAVERALAAGTLLPEGAEDLRRRAVHAAEFIAEATR